MYSTPIPINNKHFTKFPISFLTKKNPNFSTPHTKKKLKKKNLYLAIKLVKLLNIFRTKLNNK